MEDHSWNFYKDKRTDGEVKADFELGKYNEPLVVKNLPYRYFQVNGSDEFREMGMYEPDYFVRINKIWFPAEVKFSCVELKYIDLKKNQADALAEIKGVYIQATPKKYVIVGASFMTNQKEVRGYCHKLCYRYYPDNWKFWNKKIDFRIKEKYEN